MERFANWSELPAKKGSIGKKAVLWKRNDDGAQ